MLKLGSSVSDYVIGERNLCTQCTHSKVIVNILFPAFQKIILNTSSISIENPFQYVIPVYLSHYIPELHRKILSIYWVIAIDWTQGAIKSTAQKSRFHWHHIQIFKAPLSESLVRFFKWSRRHYNANPIALIGQL